MNQRKPPQSGLVIGDITVLDLARWSFSSGTMEGDSMRVHATVQGEVTAHEGVIVDFSTGKRAIKLALDHHLDSPHTLGQSERSGELSAALDTNGIDHKLLLPSDPRFRDLSETELATYNQTAFRLTPESSTQVRVQCTSSEQFSLVVPLNALRFVPADVLFDLDKGHLSSFARFIDGYLNRNSSPITVETYLDRSPPQDFLKRLFPDRCAIAPCAYTHGLACSSSFGCQNILHGHRSFVASSDVDEAVQMADYLNGAYLYNGKYRGSESGAISYNSSTRGTFTYQPGEGTHRVLIDIGNEPTVEHSAQHLESVLKPKNPFFLSEGLQKGCYFRP